MADYSLASQVQQFQAPNLLALAAQGQQMQTNAMKTQLMQQEAARDAELRQAFARPDFDPTSPQGIRTAGMLGGLDAALKAGTAARQNENLQRQTALTMAQLANQNRDIITKHGQEFRDNLRMVDAQPEDQRPAAYGRLIALLPPDLQTVFPRQYSPDAVRRGMSTTTQLLDAAKPQIQMFGDVPVVVDLATRTFTPLREQVEGAPMGGAGAPVGGAAAPVGRAGAAAAPAGFDMDRAKQAIASIESGGEYGARGPVTNRGDRAFGKYQVMGANIPSWTKEALGRSMTPAEFLASPEAQERVFETQFGKSVAKYGNPVDAASVWFSGRPLAKAGNASDVLGTTVPQYAQKFMAAYEGGANTPAMMRSPGFASSSGIPANVGLPVAPVLNAFASEQPPQQGNALAMQAAPMLQQQPVPVTTAQPQAAPAPSTLSPYQQARQDAAQRKQKQRDIETESSKRIEAQVKMETTNKERREAARQALLIVADPGIPDLIKKSTAGLGQLAKGAVYTAVTGGSTTGDIQSGKLDMITNKVALDLAGGKLGGGFSNEDREFTLRIVGNMGNKNLGTDQRIAAYEQLKELLSSIAENRAMKIVPGAVEELKLTPSARKRLTLDNAGKAFGETNVDDLLKLYPRPK